MTKQGRDVSDIKIEIVSNWRETILHFLAHIIDLSNEERQQVTECLQLVGEEGASVSLLHENLKASGLEELAKKIATVRDQGAYGPIFNCVKHESPANTC